MKMMQQVLYQILERTIYNLKVLPGIKLLLHNIRLLLVIDKLDVLPHEMPIR